MTSLIRRSHPTSTSDVEAAFVESHEAVKSRQRYPSLWWRRRPSSRVRNGAALLSLMFVLLTVMIHFQRKEPPPPQRIFPIMVQSRSEHHALPLVLTEHPHKYIKDRRNHYWIDHGVEAWRRPAAVQEGCTILNSHAQDHYPDCNNFHSIDMTDFWLFPDRHTTTLENQTRQSKLRHIGEGGFRNAFYISEYNGTRRVLKTLVWRDDRFFDISNMERNRKDSVIAAQLTSSPLVADIYGYCAQSALVDYSDDLDLYYIFDNNDNEIPTKDELFNLVVDVAQSVADMQLPNQDGMATVVHMDLKPDQWIRLNGKYVVNDFNLAKFIEYNYETKEYCNQASGYSDGRWQAPEQFTENYPRTEKADVYSLGYVFNYLLTKEKHFPTMSGKQVMKHVMEGGTWQVPSKYRKSTHPFHVAVSNAVKECLQFKPDDRPSAQDVADKLRKARDEYKKKKHKPQ